MSAAFNGDRRHAWGRVGAPVVRRSRGRDPVAFARVQCRRCLTSATVRVRPALMLGGAPFGVIAELKIEGREECD